MVTAPFENRRLVTVTAFENRRLVAVMAFENRRLVTGAPFEYRRLVTGAAFEYRRLVTAGRRGGATPVCRLRRLEGTSPLADCHSWPSLSECKQSAERS